MKKNLYLIGTLAAVACVAFIVIAALFFSPIGIAIAVTAASIFAIGAIVAAIVGIISNKKAKTDPVSGKSTYRFPILKCLLGIGMIIALAFAIVLMCQHHFWWSLIPWGLFLGGVFVLAFLLLKWKWLRVLVSIVAGLLAVALVCYCVTSCVIANMQIQTPGDNTQTPGDNTQKPGDNTQTPGDNTQTPGDNTQTPGDNTQKPGDNTQTPGDNTQTPGDNTQTPGDNTQKPGGNQNPVVVPKITAPDTMSYGVPVTVKLENVEVKNLKYGGEDFISIVKVDDNTVVLTLVGIVNDAGQVQIVPASGYITVTDAVSGESVSIRIVE